MGYIESIECSRLFDVFLGSQLIPEYRVYRQLVDYKGRQSNLRHTEKMKRKEQI